MKNKTEGFAFSFRLASKYETLPDNENNYRDYDDFVMKCFNYFNGNANKNIIKSCEVPDIYQCPNNIYIHGRHIKNESKIYVYTSNMLKTFFKELDTYGFIIEDIIVFIVCHELIHNDIETDRDKYSTRVRYRDKIELEVNLRTTKFLLNNYDKIYKDLFKGIDKEELELKFKYLNRANNKRKNPIKY